MNTRRIVKHFRTFATALAASALVLTPVWADDTEIFFADTGGEQIYPNILFIIDTSGSMGEEVGNTGEDRLEQVQAGFRTLLNQLSNVNVGVMRFSNPGGPILYPVSYIDANIDEIEQVITEVIARVSDDNDDAQELESGQVLLEEDYLHLTTLTPSGSGSGSEGSFVYYVGDGDDDAHQREGDPVRISNNQLDVRGLADQRKFVGVRFTGLEIPDDPSLLITRAQIAFTVKDVRTNGDIILSIFGEDRDSGDFSDDDIEGRNKTFASASWAFDAGDYNNGDKLLTPDLSAIILEIIADSAWGAPDAENDDAVFIFDSIGGNGNNDDGRIRFYSRDGASGVNFRPTLYLDYTLGSVEQEQQTTTGLRFTDLAIPRGVTITEAYIEFTADRDSTGNYDFDITVEDSSAPAAYTDTNGNISGRATVATSIDWAGSEAMSADQTFRTPDLSTLVQAVSARGDWCGGDDMGFVITGTEGLRTAWSNDGSPTNAANLVVKYDYNSIPDGTSCLQGTISRTIATDNDDIEEKNNGDIRRGDYELNFDRDHLVGLRFDGINVPAGAQISNAYLALTARRDDDEDIDIEISVESGSGANNAFGSDDDDLSDRSYVGTPVDWEVRDDWYDDSSYTSPDISSLVSAAVSSADWSAGNAIVLKLETSGGRRDRRRVKSFDDSPGEAPRLVIEYQSNGVGSTTRKVRDELLTIVDNLNHNGWTPVQDTLYEAARYYTGGRVLYGAKRGGPNGGGPHAYTRVSHERSMAPGSFQINYPDGCSEDDLGDNDCEDQTIGGEATYASPITNYCQKTSHIVLLTDGFANRDHSDDLIEDFVGISSCEDLGTEDGGKCVDDLVGHMANEDMSSINLEQNVITHTIGFNFSSDWLEDVAKKGGGQFAVANNADELVVAIDRILVDAFKTDNTFVAPVAAVNQFNRLNNLSDIYFAVYRPDEAPWWPGNLKKYALGDDNVILDKNGQPAVDPDQGFFKVGAIDLFNATGESLDENGDFKEDVESGGAGSNLPSYNSRKVYTYHQNSAATSLSDSTNSLDVDRFNSGQLTKAMFNAGALSDGDFEDLIEWVRGRNVPDSSDRYAFNDPLHSRPVAVTYNVSEDDPDVEIFVGSNGGGLHAISADTGIETFVFFPEATLSIQNILMENRTIEPHPYGIDGNIVPWINDNGADGIDANQGDFVRLFFGMRRGGRNYYSLDVTDRANPQFRWMIEGGAGDYAEMGQSWGTPIRGRIRLENESARDVLFISGGYDPAKDDLTTRAEDAAGRAIYIVDAEDGSLVWSGGADAAAFTKEFADMRYSIPAGLTVADVDSDGLDDIIFVGDTGGQVWRFDIMKGQAVEDLIVGGVIADLGVADGTDTQERNRRFFHAPDVALVKRGADNKAFELAVTIGSGFRASPLSNVTEDKFFMLRQRAVFGGPASYNKLTLSDLYDATDNRVGDGVDASGAAVSQVDARTDLNAKEGWYIELHNDAAAGEKVLSTPLSLDNTVTFITYTPNPGMVDCRAVAGVSKVYSVFLEDATPAVNFNDIDDILDEHDRVFTLKTPSIIDEPVVICTGQGCDVFTGAEQPPLDEILNDRITRTYWRKEQ